MGHPSGPGLTVFQETDDCFSEIYNQAKLKSPLLGSLRKVLDRVIKPERLLVVAFAYGADSDDVQKAGNASKGDSSLKRMRTVTRSYVASLHSSGNTRSAKQSRYLINHKMLRGSLD